MYGLLTEAKDETARLAFDRELDKPITYIVAQRQNGRPDAGAMMRLATLMETLEAVDG